MDQSKETTYAILRKLMSNKLACNFNFKGKNKPGVPVKKRPFVELKSYHIVAGAVVKHSDKLKRGNMSLNVEVKVINRYIMDWLKDAPKRYKNEENPDHLDDGSAA